MIEPSEPPVDTADTHMQSEEEEVTDPGDQQKQTETRSGRVRTLTEKGREMQDERIKRLQQRFN